jgi:hypothetical protein
MREWPYRAWVSDLNAALAGSAFVVKLGRPCSGSAKRGVAAVGGCPRVVRVWGAGLSSAI